MTPQPPTMIATTPIRRQNTRPLAIQKDGTWYTYGWDSTKNVCEVYGQFGYIRTLYTYTPYGSVTTDGNVTQPILWSSEFDDLENIYKLFYNIPCMSNSCMGYCRISKHINLLFLLSMKLHSYYLCTVYISHQLRVIKFQYN